MPNNAVPVQEPMLGAPEIERDWALFLDLDGTLLEIASTPAGVATPRGLSKSLGRVRDILGGALAVVSGRPLDDIDRLLHPLRLSGAGDHGAVIRFPSGVIDQVPPALRPPREWAGILRDLVRGWDGIVIEEKRYSIAVHFRLAPQRERQVRDLAAYVVGRESARFEVLAAKLALEIRPKSVTKARAVKALMETDPFRGRVPVFVGDDVTDSDGMAAARQLGGLGLEVEKMFGGQPSAVRAWLGRGARLLRKES